MVGRLHLKLDGRVCFGDSAVDHILRGFANVIAYVDGCFFISAVDCFLYRT
jgi:hypothetical protein